MPSASSFLSILPTNCEAANAIGGEDGSNWSLSTQPKVLADDHGESLVWQRPLAVLQMERAERDVVQSLDHGIVTPYNTLKTLLYAKGPTVPQVTAVILYYMWVRAPSTAAVYDGISVLVDDEVTLHASIAAFIEEHVVVGTVGKPRCRVNEQWMRLVLDNLVIDEFKLRFTDDKIREALYAKWIAFVQSNVWYDSCDAWVDLFTGKMTINGKPMAAVDASERVDAAVCGDMGEFLMPHFSDIGDQHEYNEYGMDLAHDSKALEECCVSIRQNRRIRAQLGSSIIDPFAHM